MSRARSTRRAAAAFTRDARLRSIAAVPRRRNFARWPRATGRLVISMPCPKRRWRYRWPDPQLSSRRHEMAGQPPSDVAPQPVEFRRGHIARTEEVDENIAVDPPGSCAHHQHPIGKQHGFLDRMGHENDRDAGTLPDLQQLVLELLAGERIQRAERL